MFNNLLESKPKKEKRGGGTVASIVLHGVLIVGAVYATANAQIQIGAFPKGIIFDRSVVTWSLHSRWEMREGNFSIPVDRKQVGRETGTQVRLYSMGDTSLRTITRTFRNNTGGPPPGTPAE